MNHQKEFCSARPGKAVLCLQPKSISVSPAAMAVKWLDKCERACGAPRPAQSRLGVTSTMPL